MKRNGKAQDDRVKFGKFKLDPKSPWPLNLPPEHMPVWVNTERNSEALNRELGRRLAGLRCSMVPKIDKEHPERFCVVWSLMDEKDPKFTKKRTWLDFPKAKKGAMAVDRGEADAD